MSARTGVARAGAVSARTGAGVRPGPRLTGRAAVLLVIVTVLAVFAVVPARELLAERGRIAELERQAQVLQAENRRLVERIARLHDPVELERLARECLGMVRPGEIAFVTTPRSGDEGPASC